jgi:citrate synthase (EC 2.3.3.1)
MSEEVKEVTIATSGKIIQTPCGPIIHGLEDVLVKTTTISDIDGKNGILWYRGYRIDDLAKYSTFEEVAYLILYGKLPNRKELDDFKSLLASYRELPNEVYSIVTTMGKVKAHPMLALEAGVAALGAFDENPSDYSKEANLRRAIKLTSALPIMIAAHYRASRGLDIVKPRKDLSHAANFLYMMFGKEPDETSTKAIDLYLVLHIDHEVPASTFATLVAISTWTDLYSAIAAGIATLKGPLHGGANEAAMKQYLEIKTPENARPYVEKLLAEGKRLMGVGHRVYKAYDPRARIYKELVKQLSEAKGNMTWYNIASEVEKVVLEKLAPKKLYPNVDFWSGIAMYLLGIPYEYYTPIFAMSRIVGWAAHAIEYLDQHRLFRPRACYTGPHDVPYVPMEKRS